MKTKLLTTIALSCSAVALYAQSSAYVASTEGSRALVKGVDMGDVEWTDGFWKERFDMVMPVVVPAQYDYFMNFSENNFKILAEDKKDEGFQGTYWQDGDYYKWLEAQIAVYSVTKDPQLLESINEKAKMLAAAVADDGYFTTHTQIGYGVMGTQTPLGTPSTWSRKFENRERFKASGMHETYNMGHFLTMACTHYRATGDRTLLDAAIRVGDFLDGYFSEVTKEMGDQDANPTQIMGLMELYRATGEERYMELANRFITGRGQSKGETQNQNDTQLRLEDRAVGHAVLGTVLYCGAADYVAEHQDDELEGALKAIWEDIYTRKASFTAGLGNVHRGPSQTVRNRNECTHEAFGYPYQLQNSTAYNETCATYYGAFFSWRLFLLTGEAKYLDVMERAFYNNLSAMQLDGRSYYYTNVLRWHGADHQLLSLDFNQRWTMECPCVCCPTSVARFLAESKEYAYARDDNSLYVTLYGSNNISTTIAGQEVEFVQQSSYPWSEVINMEYKGQRNAEFALKLRIPEWAEGATVNINGSRIDAAAGEFAVVERKWKSGDKIELTLPMRPIINEANPLVEEARGQVAVSYGPLAYCIEGCDLPHDVSIENVILPVDTKFDVKMEKDLLGGVKTITADAVVRTSEFNKDRLYAPLKGGYEKFQLKLIPYYAWSNRGEYEMSVFMPVQYNVNF
ncbi:MAG: beta-L-arabinofuranosidase domain-containing protein [Rikenellaceae bacterium]